MLARTIVRPRSPNRYPLLPTWGWKTVTDFVSDLLKIQEQIAAQLRDADREAVKLASADINSPEAVQAIDKELKLKELKRKVDDLVDRVFEIFQ
jgi:hypothetical protein